MDDIVGRPRRVNGAAESKHSVFEPVIAGRLSRQPRGAFFDRFVRAAMQERAGVGLIGAAPDIFQSPLKTAHHAVVVGGPAAMFVAADCLFEPAHGGQTNEYSLAMNLAQTLGSPGKLISPNREVLVRIGSQ